MAGVTIGYKGSTIATIQGTGSKTLLTEGKYCEDDITVDYVQESGGGITPTGTKSITTNGTHDVTNYASASVNVQPNVTSKSVTANGTYNAASDNVDGYSSVSVNVPVGASGVYRTTAAVATHSSGNVALCTLPDNVYAHKDDDSFGVIVINTTPSSLVTYDEYYLFACNNPNVPKVSSFPVYGMGLRKNSDTAVSTNHMFYPPNSANNTTSLGGIGKLWLNNKVLTYKSREYYFGAGTYLILVFW